MEENGRLGRAGGPEVMVRGHRVEQLGEDGPGHPARAILDQAQAEMDMAEEFAFVRGQEERAAVELAGPADVVQERRGDEQVAAQAWVELCDIATDRRHRDGVLQEAPGIGMVALGRGGEHS
jgi:hypothetical protein